IKKRIFLLSKISILSIFCLKAQPLWFDSVKLGIMIHYGLYSVPSYSDKEQYAEWFYKGLISNDTNRINFQQKVFGKDFSYFDYMKLFKGEMFNADDWAKLFKDSGAGYVLFSSKHHDGFCLYDSKYTEYTSLNSAANRDFCEELSVATRKAGLRFGLYYSLMEWTNPIFRWTIDSVGIDSYVNNHLLPQFKEIVDKFKPSVVFADGDWDFTYQTLRSEQMIDYLTEKVGKDEVAYNDRWGQGFKGGFKTPEYSSGLKDSKNVWSECRSLSRSFGLNRNSPIEDYLTSKELIHHFVKLVSLGGGLMLNVSPSSDGQIPLMQQERLLDLGSWLKINGKAIYGTKPYEKNFEYQDMVCPMNDSTINFSWVRNAPVKGASEDNFAISWHNKISVNKTEIYTIYLDADDEASLEIKDGNKTIFANTAKKDLSIVGKVRLKKGKSYEFNLFYKEKDIDASCHLYWESKTISKRPIQSDSSLWNGELSWQEPYICYTKKDKNLYAISLQKLGRIIEMNLPNKPKDNMKVYLLGNEDKLLSWKYNNGKLTVDTSTLHSIDIKSDYAYVFCLEDYIK